MLRFFCTAVLVLFFVAGCSDDTDQPVDSASTGSSSTSVSSGSASVNSSSSDSSASASATSSSSDSSASASATSTHTMAEDLIISEYVEGSGNNKYIELFNWTGHPVNLGIYKLRIYINGATVPDHDLALSGSLTNGETFVIANKFADKWTNNIALTDELVMSFNGNDVIELIADNVVVDRIGTLGAADDFAKDVTLRRKPFMQPTDSWNADQWYICNLNDVSGLGTHDWLTESGKPDTNSSALPVDYPDGSNGSQVYISEYFEGDSNDKYIELYNGGSGSIDLSQYILVRHDYDASGTRVTDNDYAVRLSGTLYANNCYLVVNGGYNTNNLSNLYYYEGYNFLKEDVSVYPQAICFFGGNDPVMLVYNGQVIDRVGSGGVTVWGKDVKLVRKSGKTGSVTWDINDWDSTITKEEGVSGTIAGSDITAGTHTP